jgi:hypothetical protein
MGIWQRKRDSVGNALRSARPEASEDLVARLGGDVASASARPARRSRGSRVAFGTALLVFVLGSFASFGGLSYAATGAKNTATAVQKAVAPAKAEPKQTSATAQYDEEQVPTPPTGVDEEEPPVVQIAGESAGPQPAGDTLPFTGFGLGMTVALGAALLLLGIVLRRREARE